MRILEMLKNIKFYFRWRKVPADVCVLLFHMLPCGKMLHGVIGEELSHSVIDFFSSAHLCFGRFKMKCLSFQLIRNAVHFQLAGSLRSPFSQHFPPLFG